MARILVIDDEDAVRIALGFLLEEAGYTVMQAPDGKAGMKLYRATPADLVITDLLMPEQEGLGTIMELRQLAPSVPIIAISGGGRHGLIEFLDVAKQFGAKRTFAKPIKPQELLTAVRELLGEESA